MKQIYEQAESVDIWLGPGDEQIDITLSSMNEFVAASYSWQQHSDIFDDIFRPFLRSLPLISWTAIWRILINPWWKLDWGLQEASTPRNDVSLISGHQRIPGWRGNNGGWIRGSLRTFEIC
jgi:hypothetical protein